jgi:hypothetical protein
MPRKWWRRKWNKRRSYTVAIPSGAVRIAMANITILMKGPGTGNVPSGIPVSIATIPGDQSQPVGTTWDLSQYIIDEGGIRTSTEVTQSGTPLPDPVTNASSPTSFVSYDPATELLHFDYVGQAQSLVLEVTF